MTDSRGMPFHLLSLRIASRLKEYAQEDVTACLVGLFVGEEGMLYSINLRSGNCVSTLLDARRQSSVDRLPQCVHEKASILVQNRSGTWRSIMLCQETAGAGSQGSL